jgi:hypothetical protein
MQGMPCCCSNVLYCTAILKTLPMLQNTLTTSWDASVTEAATFGSDDRSSNSKNFAVSRNVLQITQPIRRIPGAFSQVYCVCDVKLTKHLHLAQRLRMHGAIPQLLKSLTLLPHTVTSKQPQCVGTMTWHFFGRSHSGVGQVACLVSEIHYISGC